jgi:hypothetical protein
MGNLYDNRKKPWRDMHITMGQVRDSVVILRCTACGKVRYGNQQFLDGIGILRWDEDVQLVAHVQHYSCPAVIGVKFPHMSMEKLVSQ